MRTRHSKNEQKELFDEPTKPVIYYIRMPPNEVFKICSSVQRNANTTVGE